MHNNFRQLKHLFTIKALLVLSLWAWMQLTNTAAAQSDELLPPEEAFAFEARLDESVVQASWTIAEGYYMYADKMAFSLKDGEANLGAFEWPKGKQKQDPLFGEVMVYTDRVDFNLPLSEPVSALRLEVRGQGCNEPIGVCYPPITHLIDLVAGSPAMAGGLSDGPVDGQVNDLADELGFSPLEDSDASEFGSLDELRDLLGAQAAEDEFLPVDEAFELKVEADGAGQLLAQFDVAEGYFIYQNKIKFTANGQNLANIAFPQGKLHQDEYFGEVMVYEHDFSLPISFSSNRAQGQELLLEAQYQGCADKGICYPPVNKSFTIALPALVGSAAAATDVGADLATSLGAEPAQSADNSGKPALTKSIWLMIAGAFVAGIGLTFTPCVLPLIPILSSVIAGQGPGLSKTKSLWLAGAYVLGTAVTYAAMGALAGATGAQLQAYFQNVWAIGLLAIIFVLMALSMFGLFTVQMPAFIQSRIQAQSQDLRGGTIPMVFILGLVSALIVGACVSPVLFSFLGIAIAQGSASLGAVIMFSMALGMGVPLVLIALGAGHLMPKAGQWMDTVKHAFGVMLLAVAIYLLGVLPGVPVLLLWAALFIVVAVYLGATQSLARDASGWQKLLKGVGTLLLIWGALALIGGLYGERDILRPLPSTLLSSQGTVGANGAVISQHLFKRVDNESQLETQLAQAQTQGKFVVIDYYADWCVDCVRMEKSTFIDPAVQAKIKAEFLALQVDVTDPNDPDRANLKKRYGVFGPPAMLFFDPAGNQIKDKSFYGYKNAEDFLAHLNSL